MGKFTVFALAGLVVTLVAGAPQRASARVDLCELGIGRAARVFKAKAALALGACTHFARRERDFLGPLGFANMPRAAFRCERFLDRVWNMDQDTGNPQDFRDALSKLIATLDRLVATGRCAAGDIEVLGHMVGGQSAPPVGGNEIDWLKYKIAVWKTWGAWMWLLKAKPQADALFQVMINTSNKAKNPLNPFPRVDCKPGALEPITETAGTFDTFPNLCAWSLDFSTVRNDFDPSTGTLRNLCWVHECEIKFDPDPVTNDASFTRVILSFPGSEPVKGSDAGAPAVTLGGSTAYKFCKTVGNPRFEELLGGDDFRGIGGMQAQTINRVRLDASRVVCVRGLTTEGWCDCTGDAQSLAATVDHCVDHSVIKGSGKGPGGVPAFPPSAEYNATDDCSTPSIAPQSEEECFCTLTPEPCGGPGAVNCVPIFSEPCRTNDDCSTGPPAGECRSRAGGSNCHPNTFNSASRKIITGPNSEEGDCLVFTTTSLTIVRDNPGGEGTCDCPGTAQDPRECKGTLDFCIRDFPVPAGPPFFGCPGPGANQICLRNDGERCAVDAECVCNKCDPFVGPDGTVCTMDDTPPRGAAGQSTLTTKAAIATVENAVFFEGSCVGGASQGLTCFEDRNCAGLCAPAECEKGRREGKFCNPAFPADPNGNLGCLAKCDSGQCDSGNKEGFGCVNNFQCNGSWAECIPGTPDDDPVPCLDVPRCTTDPDEFCPSGPGPAGDAECTAQSGGSCIVGFSEDCPSGQFCFSPVPGSCTGRTCDGGFFSGEPCFPGLCKAAPIPGSCAGGVCDPRLGAALFFSGTACGVPNGDCGAGPFRCSLGPFNFFCPSGPGPAGDAECAAQSAGTCIPSCGTSPTTLCPNGDSDCADAFCTVCRATSIGLVRRNAPVIGSPINCAEYDSSFLAGWIMVNAFPFVDAAAIGDGISIGKFICE